MKVKEESASSGRIKYTNEKTAFGALGALGALGVWALCKRTSLPAPLGNGFIKWKDLNYSGTKICLYIEWHLITS